MKASGCCSLSLLVGASLFGGCEDSVRPPQLPQDRHPELVQTFEVMPGTCGVSRSITLLRGDLEVEGILRAPAGFVAWGRATTSRRPGWLSLSVDGASQRISISDWNEPTAVLANFPFALSLTDLHPVLLTSVGAQDAARLHAWPLDRPGAERDIGVHFGRGSTRSTFASSLDGKRAVFAAEHPATFPPHLVPLDSNGAVVGAQFTLPDEGAVACLSAIPTADSFAVEVLYTTPTPRLKVVIATNPTGPFMRALASPSCPLLQLDGLLTVAAAEDDKVRFFVLASGEILSVISDPPLLVELGSVPLWLSRHQGGDFTLLVIKEGRRRLVEMSTTGALTWHAADLPPGTVIPSAPGELFLDVFEPDLAGVFAHRIVQVECNGAGFAK